MNPNNRNTNYTSTNNNNNIVGVNNDENRPAFVRCCGIIEGPILVENRDSGSLICCSSAHSSSLAKQGVVSLFVPFVTSHNVLRGSDFASATTKLLFGVSHSSVCIGYSQAFINQSFENITSIEHSLKLLHKFQSILQRESLKSDLDSKLNIIFQVRPLRHACKGRGEIA